MAAAGCSASNDIEFSAGGAGGNGSGGSSGSFTSSSGNGAGGGLGVDGGSSSGAGGGNQIAEVYGHSAVTLYRMDPTTKQVTVVGNFQGCSSVIDIALDKDSNLFGTTFDGLYRIDKNTAVCTHIASGGYPNSLSFVPKGTVDPNAEALVGYQGATYVRIDTVTGAITPIGSLQGGLSSSGDIVSVINGKTLLTVNGLNCGDCIVEVNPTTGDMIQNWGPLGYASVFGLAFWAGKAYGFNDAGQLFEIEFGMTNVMATPIPIPSAPPGLSFWGAGSTTSAPPIGIPQ
jgi:hypothetical protein